MTWRTLVVVSTFVALVGILLALGPRLTGSTVCSCVEVRS